MPEWKHNWEGYNNCYIRKLVYWKVYLMMCKRMITLKSALLPKDRSYLREVSSHVSSSRQETSQWRGSSHWAVRSGGSNMSWVPASSLHIDFVDFYRGGFQNCSFVKLNRIRPEIVRIFYQVNAFTVARPITKRALALLSKFELTFCDHSC